MLSTDPHAKLFERVYSPTLSGQGPAPLDEAITEPFVAHTAGHAPIGGPGRLAEHWEAVTEEAVWDAFWSSPAG
ncbi:hypothetical protein ACFY36_00770 [Actinoplanes sp. NPDC000266]